MPYSDSDTIFVALAAYCEPELALTIRDCFDKAESPERLRLGICLQYDETGVPEVQEDCIDFLLDDPRLRAIKFDHRMSRGGCWARHHSQTLYRGETYTLQVDAHTRFIEHWDRVLVDMLHDIPGERKLITGFPPLYWREDGIETFANADHLDKVETTVLETWHDDGSITHPNRDIPGNTAVPRRTRFLSGAFVFSTGDWIKTVPQDPDHLYHGEEFALTLRSYTHGFDLFNPDRIVVWHRCHPEPNRKFITDFPEDVVQERHKGALERLKLLYAGDPLGRLGRFSLGTRRTLADFFIYSGLNVQSRWAHPHAYEGVPPDPVTIQ